MIGIVDDHVGEPRQGQKADRRVRKFGPEASDLRVFPQAARRIGNGVPKCACRGGIVAGNPVGTIQEIPACPRRKHGRRQRDGPSITASISSSTSSSW